MSDQVGIEVAKTEDQFIVAGCPRSGTTLMYFFLKKLGVEVQHEGYFRPEMRDLTDEEVAGYSNCGFSAVSWLASPHLCHYPGMRVIHLVRDPYATINSMLYLRIWEPIAGRKDREYWDYLSYFVGVAGRSQLDTACKAWAQLNRFCLAHPGAMVVRLENLRSSIGRLVAYLGLDISVDEAEQVYDAMGSRYSNARPDQYQLVLRPKAGLGEEVREIAKELGYESHAARLHRDIVGEPRRVGVRAAYMSGWRKNPPRAQAADPSRWKGKEAQ